MGSLSPKAFFVFAFLLNVVLLAQHLRGGIQTSSSVSHLSSSSLVRRILDASYDSPGECLPLGQLPTEQCQHVHDSCNTSDTFIGVQYLATYFCTEQTLRPLTFLGLLLWLLFLFSTLGISASDFFTPNLGTIATLLGLDENVAGVTFLAFGNGSPDVFSTFSSMRAGSGSLAIGELLGAASFIVSCVVGSMCIIKPFAIPRGPFLRDVGFFTAAVVFLFVALLDHKITWWEAAILLAFYVVYVIVVVVGSWWSRRQARIRLDDEVVRSEYRDDDDTSFSSEPYHDNPNSSSLHLEIPRTRVRALSNPQFPSSSSSTGTRNSPLSQSYHSGSPPAPHMMPSFSLVGALEFRHVVSSLQLDAAGHSLSAFDSPVTPYAGGHYHNRTLSRRGSTRSTLHEHDPFDTAMGVQLNSRTLRPSMSIHSSPLVAEVQITGDQILQQKQMVSKLNPSCPFPHRSVLPKIRHVLKLSFHALFPSLAGFRQKGIPGQIASLFAAPAILLLTVTLPVVVTPYVSGNPEHHHHHHHHNRTDDRNGDGRLIEFEEEGEERALLAAEEVEGDIHTLSFNKWLMAVQCVLGPIFCGLVLTVYAIDSWNQISLVDHACCGFMAIADEVVQVLQTFGFIFGLSDAIIGLTVFAVGNSLADLVANMSVAVFAPIMGFAACFGGPMLNILIGVGGSGSLHHFTHQRRTL
ncbi:Sodium/calcium exchanger protein-domain-containing protein [Flagelloscypha sp. PMI_526]|nr:Sodium/calcium exchanger protein-domain-containing protein [Flagelloscypha sp. PMI_526]